MPGEKYVVDLQSDERDVLLGVTGRGRLSARKMKRVKWTPGLGQ